MNKIRINQGRVFMAHLRLGGSFFVLFMIAICFNFLPEIAAIPAAILVSLGWPLLWSSFEVLEIDPGQKTISEFILIMGRRLNSHETRFDQLDKIFINQVGMAQTMHSWSGKVNTAKSTEYHAYLKLANGKKIFVISDKRSESLKGRIAPIAQKLGVQVEENY